MYEIRSTCLVGRDSPTEVLCMMESLAEAIFWVWKEYLVTDCEIVDKDFMEVWVETLFTRTKYSIVIERQ